MNQNNKVNQKEAVSISREVSNQVEELIGGAHHEINNFNFLISTSIEIINMLDPKDPDMETKKDEYVKKIDLKMKEINKTLSSLRTIVRDASNEEVESVSLKDMTEEALLLCKRRFNNHHVILKTNIESDFVLQNRKTQIIQSLLSLLNNSHDAVAKLEDDSGAKWIDLNIRENKQKLEIVVKDSAPLIAKADIPNLFEPHSVIQGRKGLALLIVKDNIESNGGTIEYAVIDKCNAIIISFDEYSKVSSAEQSVEPMNNELESSNLQVISRTKVG